MPDRLRPAPRTTALVVLILGAVACAPDAPAPQPESGTETVPPTDLERVPPALRGDAPPPFGESVRYLEGDPLTEGYLAVPDGEGPFPAVILIHEWNGLVDRIRQTADALAAEGYVALAADLFRGAVGNSPDENRALVQQAQEDPEAIITNLDGALHWLRARPDVAGAVAVMGWCFGGGVALTFASDGAFHEGTAIFYGRLVDDPEVLSGISHEIYGTFGALDAGPSPEEVEAFALALREAGVPNDIHVYDGVGHGFWLYVDRDPAGAAGPAAHAWQRLLDYLGRVL